MKQIDLIWLGDSPPGWGLGRTASCAPLPGTLRRALDEAARGTAAFVLIWDSRLGRPDEVAIEAVSGKRGDSWHAGLRLGTGGLPRALDAVAPNWSWNADPDPGIEGTSWRLSLRCCLLARRAIGISGGVCAEFESLEGAGLDFGLRAARSGLVLRHVPELAGAAVAGLETILPEADELRWIARAFGRNWARWAAFRGWQLGLTSGIFAIRAVRGGWGPAPQLEAYHDPAAVASAEPAQGRVTVIIPTVDRYPYLRTVLEQLTQQTVAPHQVLVVDQTPAAGRDPGLAAEFAGRLPLEWIFLDEAGQCSSRNEALRRAAGEYLLLADDDIEMRPDFIESHLRTIRYFGCDVCSGVLREVGAGELAADFRRVRPSDVFPASNSLVSRRALEQSGLFDLAFDRGERADADLGMRLAAGGALMILNSAIDVLHHRAPRGGLRTHGARVVTYASSRKKIRHRHLPSVSEIYLALRYFRPDQVREMLLLRAAGTLAGGGGLWRRLLKAAYGALLLPSTWRRIGERRREAEAMLERYPQIALLDGTRVEAGAR